jgi:hypothetical protein
MLFFITGGIGLVLIVPLFAAMLRPESDAPYLERLPTHRVNPRLILAAPLEVDDCVARRDTRRLF